MKLKNLLVLSPISLLAIISLVNCQGEDNIKYQIAWRGKEIAEYDNKTVHDFLGDDETNVKTITFTKSGGETKEDGEVFIGESDNDKIFAKFNTETCEYTVRSPHRIVFSKNDCDDDDDASFFLDFYDLTTIDFSNFELNDDIDNLNYMFGNCCDFIEAKNASSLNITNIKSFKGLFSGCSNNLVKLDLSTFDTKNVVNMDSMFYKCGKLTTIFVSDKFVVDNVTESEDMFTDCAVLKGGNGTTYDADHTDKEYARIDKKGEPGYFTSK